MTAPTRAELRERTAARLEDALFMRDHGEHPEMAAQRIGIKLGTLDKLLKRHGVEWPGWVERRAA